MRVGFVGLGNMGGHQAQLIAAAGFDLTVFDVWPDALKAFEGKARLASSPAEVGRQAEIVGVCVRDDQQVREVVAGSEGLFSGLAPGSLVLVHSTVAPATVVALAEQGDRKGIGLIDAAVTSSRMERDKPFVVTMTGGDPALTERARPVLEAFSTGVEHCGALGAGMGLKITNNFITWSNIITIRQALRLAAAGGVDMDTLSSVLQQNGNLTAVTGAVAKQVIQRRGAPLSEEQLAYFTSQGKIGEKDLSLAVDFARDAGVALPLAEHGRAFTLEMMTMQ
ncbi:NAD(P)-dependent oxidoreductase [Flavisphingomonas formosensis]|uniref:NAD(P)-dependent oxidoreductase n=1 Tax=Flavisphingomonas formosensis TaxID=861534 RepID=UPI0018E01CAF|nr:NAD(P)-dependent oxidoreductase [Sphingomonas formosensis]